MKIRLLVWAAHVLKEECAFMVALAPGGTARYAEHGKLLTSLLDRKNHF